MSRLLAGAAGWEPSRPLSDPAARPVSGDSLDLAVRADGKAFVAWNEARGAVGPYTLIYGCDYDSATVSCTVSQQISTTWTGGGATLAMNDAEVVLAWADASSGNIFSRRRAPSPGIDHFTYTYDGLKRLTSVSGPSPESITFDAATSITSRTGPSATNSYDTSNRQASDGTRSFVWSPADRLLQRPRGRREPGRLGAAATTPRSTAWSAPLRLDDDPGTSANQLSRRSPSALPR